MEYNYTIKEKIDNFIPLWIFPVILLITTGISYLSLTNLLKLNKYNKTDYNTILNLIYAFIGISVIEFIFFIYSFYSKPVYEIKKYQTRLLIFVNLLRVIIMSISSYLINITSLTKHKSNTPNDILQGIIIFVSLLNTLFLRIELTQGLKFKQCKDNHPTNHNLRCKYIDKYNEWTRNTK